MFTCDTEHLVESWVGNKQSIMVHPTTFVLQFCEGISLKADDLFLLSYVRKTKTKFQTIHFGQIKDQLESKTVKMTILIFSFLKNSNVF